MQPKGTRATLLLLTLNTVVLLINLQRLLYVDFAATALPPCSQRQTANAENQSMLSHSILKGERGLHQEVSVTLLLLMLNTKMLLKFAETALSPSSH